MNQNHRSAAGDGTAPIRLRVTSDPANLAPVRKSIEQFCVNSGLSLDAAGEVGLCVNEAMANVTRHAYGGATDRPVEVAAECANQAVRVQIRDWGNGRQPPPEPRHDPLKPGGLGLVCLKSLMEEVRFTPLPDGMLLSFARTIQPRKAAMTTLTTHTDLVPAARKEGDAVIATVHGDIDLHNSPELRTAILALLQQNSPKNLVLNLSQVPYMDSSAIAVLVEALQKMRKTGGRVCLTNLQPRVQGLLEIARLGTIFSILKDEKDALQQ